MDYFGINSAADLPKIREVLAEQLVEGTRPEDFRDQPIAEHIGYDALEEEETPTENISSIAVNQDGELIIPQEDPANEESPSAETPTDVTDQEDKDPSKEAGEEEKPE
jgi:segregation and condensation protein B